MADKLVKIRHIVDLFGNFTEIFENFHHWERPIPKKRKRSSRTLITDVTSNVRKFILYFLFLWIVTKLNLKIKLNGFKVGT